VLSLKKHFHLTTHIRYFEYGSLATFGARFEKKKTLQYLVMLQYPPESQGSCRGQAFLVRAFSFSFSFHILFFIFSPVIPLNLAGTFLALAIHVLEPLGAALAVHVL
jgi:hypothetical protein